MMHKIKILALTSMLSIPLCLHAQVGDKRNDFSLGVSGGATITRIDFSPKIKQSYKINPTFGVTMRYVCEKYFSSICAVQVEVNYAQLGWKELIEDGTGNTYIRDLSYIQIPLFMQMGWGREERGVKFFLNAGPQIGVYLGGKETKG